MNKYGLEININDIKMSLKDNIIGRNKKLKNIIKLLNSMDSHYSISLDGTWGSGKTFFLKQLQYIYESENVLPIEIDLDEKEIKKFKDDYLFIYYNAWENDNHSSGIESMLYYLVNVFSKSKDIVNPKEELKKFTMDKLKKVVEILSTGLIQKENLDNITTYSQLAEKIVTLEDKQKAVKSLLECILKDEKRIVLVIDELDRCKPSFAVEILETIKHFYSNDKITVLTATNITQLEETIKCYYGNNFNAYGYLEKFFDLVISINIENLDEYVRKYFEIYVNTNLPENITVALFKYFKFSYRQCNKYMNMYKLILNYINYDKNYSFSEQYLFESSIILPIALACKVHNNKMYTDFINGDGEYLIKEFFEYINHNNRESRYVEWIGEILKVSEEVKIEEVFRKRYHETVMLKSNYGYEFPFNEAIELLGDNIIV